MALFFPAQKQKNHRLKNLYRKNQKQKNLHQNRKINHSQKLTKNLLLLHQNRKTNLYSSLKTTNLSNVQTVLS
jgi:hypothetical protein